MRRALTKKTCLDALTALPVTLVVFGHNMRNAVLEAAPQRGEVRYVAAKKRGSFDVFVLFKTSLVRQEILSEGEIKWGMSGAH